MDTFGHGTRLGTASLLVLTLAAGWTGLAPAAARGEEPGRIREEDAAAFDDPSGLLPKLILAKPGLLYETIDGKNGPVDAFAIYFWLKDDGKAITRVGNDEWVRVGETPAHPVGWMKNEGLIVWKTRCLLHPLPRSPDTAFTVTLRDGSIALYEGGGPESVQIAPILTTPQDRNKPVYDVAIFTGPVNAPVDQASAPGHGNENENALGDAKGKRELAVLKLEIVLVVDTTRGMTPLIDETKEVVRSIVDLLGKNPKDKGVVSWEFHTSMNAGDPRAVHNGTNRPLDRSLEDIAGARTLQEKGAGTPQGEKPRLASPPKRSQYLIASAAGARVPDELVLTGSAKAVSGSGHQVAIEKILVHKDELKKFKATLDFLCSNFEDLVDPEKRKDVSAILNVLQQASASLLSGQDVPVTAASKLDQLIGSLPLQNDASKLSAGEIALMPPEEYTQWLKKLKDARDLAAQLFDNGPWFSLQTANGKKQFTFIRPEDLP